MDVDPVNVKSQMTHTHSNLKRSTSAPMINDLTSSSANSVTVRSSALPSRFCTSPLSHMRVCDSAHRSNSRLRRFSATYVPAHTLPPVSPGGSGVRTPSRLLQIRQEENVEELAIRHERNIHTAFQMSQSCEDLVLQTEQTLSGEIAVPPSGKRSLTDPLHLNIHQQQALTSPSVFSARDSPTRALSTGTVSGPTRLGCLSPSLTMSARLSQQPFSPPASPSPTRRSSLAGRRSMSPITLRPSPLGGSVSKRKLADGDCVVESGTLTPKRFHPGTHCLSPGTHMLLSAVTTAPTSPAAMDQSSGHLSVNTADTPDSMSSAGSPCVGYKSDSPPLLLPASRPHVQRDSSSQPDISNRVFRPVHDVSMETGSSHQTSSSLSRRQLSEQTASSTPMAVDVLGPMNFPM